MSYRILKEDGEGEPTTDLPPYETRPVQQTPRGYVYVPLNSQQHQQVNTVVASQPRSIPEVTVEQPRPKTRPAMLIFTLVLTILCGVHLCFPAFVCLTPALIFAIVGYSLSDSPSDEQKKTAKAFHGVALCCNISTIIYYVVAAIIFIIAGGTSLGLWLHYRDNYYYDDAYYTGGCYEDCSGTHYNGYYSTTGYYEDYGCNTICVD